MELLFVWVKEYKNLKDIGLNFSSKYKFSIKEKEGAKKEKEGAKKKYELEVCKKDTYIENFFEKKNIVDICAIVGENGAGKSHILEFIAQNLPSGYNYGSDNSIIVYQLHPTTIIISTTAVIDYSNCESMLKGEVTFRTTDRLGGRVIVSPSPQYIYYSNAFDLKEPNQEITGFFDISTLFFLKETQDLNKYRTGEIERNVYYLANNYKNFTETVKKPPPVLTMSVIESSNENLLKQNNLKRLVAGWDRNMVNHKELEYLKRVLHKEIFLRFIYYSKQQGFYIHVGRQIGGDDVVEYVRNFFEKLPQRMYKDKNGYQYSVGNHDEMSKSFTKFFSIFEKLIEDGTVVLGTVNGSKPEGLEFRILESDAGDETRSENLKKFLESYFDLTRNYGFLEFNWRGLSSGEQSFLTLFSRFYWLKTKSIAFNQNGINKHLVVLMDEGDLYFHPSWQREFLKKIIDFLSNLFSESEIQIICTSNTPFITSDLTKNHIIFLSKDEEGETKIVDNKEETFAANIHSLLSHAFYMGGSLMGEFAEDKIKDLLTLINSNKIDETNIEGYNKLIEVIGEPIIKNKLKQMLNNSPNARIKILEAEIKRIQEESKKPQEEGK